MRKNNPTSDYDGISVSVCVLEHFMYAWWSYLTHKRKLMLYTYMYNTDLTLSDPEDLFPPHTNTPTDGFPVSLTSNLASNARSWRLAPMHRQKTHTCSQAFTNKRIHTHTRVPPPFSGSGLSPVLICAVISVSRACLGTGRLGSPSLARRDNSYFPFDVFVFLSISINLQFMWSGWGVCCKSRHCVAVC